MKDFVCVLLFGWYYTVWGVSVVVGVIWYSTVKMMRE